MATSNARRCWCCTTSSPTSALPWRSSKAADGDRDAALTMAGSLGMFWHLGRHLEGRQVLSRLVGSHDGSPAARALALQAVSIVERPRGCLVHPNPRCAEAAEESLALFEELGDTWHAALSRVLLAVEGVTGAHPDRSQALLAAAEEQFDRDGDPWGPAVIGFVRMETAIKTGDVETAVRIGRTTAVAFRQLDDAWGLSATLYHLGWGLRQFGRFAMRPPSWKKPSTSHEAPDCGTPPNGHSPTSPSRRSTSETTTRHAGCSTKQQPRPARSVTAQARYSPATATASSPTCRRTGTGPRGTTPSPGTRSSTSALPCYEGITLAALGRCHEAHSDLVEAETRYQEALEVGRRLGEPSVTASALEGLARLAFATGDRDWPPRDPAKRLDSVNGSTGRHHRTSVPILSTSTRPDVRNVAT